LLRSTNGDMTWGLAITKPAARHLRDVPRADLERIGQRLDRLTRSDTKIDSLNALTKFAKERWPEHYPADFRKDEPGSPYGRAAVKAIWCAYLDWAETAAEKKPSVPKAVGA